MPELTPQDKAEELKRLRGLIESGGIYKRDQAARDILASVVSLLSFNRQYHDNVQQYAALICSRSRFTQDYLTNSKNQIDLLIGQAINDLEHLPVIIPPVIPPASILPAATPLQMTAEHDFMWYIWHCTSVTRAKIFSAFLGTAVLFYLLGRNNLIGEIIKLISKSIKP